MRDRLWSSHLVGRDLNLGTDAERNPIIFNHRGNGVIFLSVFLPGDINLRLLGYEGYGLDVQNLLADNP
jgi:hypothetical protein